MKSVLCKLVQRQTYDVLSHRYGTLLIFCGTVLIVVSALHFGETVMEWSQEKYAVVFNSFTDNVAAQSFRKRLCSPLPVDIVYSWVNGTDPGLILELRKLRQEMETELNLTKNIFGAKQEEERCTFTNCLPANMVIFDPVLPREVTLFNLANRYPVYLKAQRMFEISSASVENENYTVVEFSKEKDVIEAVKFGRLEIDGKNVTVKRVYYTSDWTVYQSVLLHDTIIMSGFPHKHGVAELKVKFPLKYQKAISKVDVYKDQGLAVLHIQEREMFESLLQDKNLNISFDGKEPTLNPANLVWILTDYTRNEDISASRFEDNEELRYSLRSIEKFAPWIRHVFIVTNGQIPSWLNLDNPRVTLISHEDIFVNKSHLPTFSSPAIESHLHRIPGLSNNFIYLNDDVMFGKEVWPDDFYTHSNGHKVYMTWPIPHCNEGCPSTWIKDGYCDKSCNNSECEWDGGDCHGQVRNLIQQHGAMSWHGRNWQNMAKVYCSSGCANSWLADKYCDQTCNVKDCGFDAGDCGVSNFQHLLAITLTVTQTTYTLPPGVTTVFFNLTELLTAAGRVDTALYNSHAAIRVAAVLQKFQVMSLLLYPEYNATNLTFQLQGHRKEQSDTVELNFTLSLSGKTLTSAKRLHKMKTPNSTRRLSPVTTALEKDEVFVFEDIPEDQIKPWPAKHQPPETFVEVGNFSLFTLPENVRNELVGLEHRFQAGDLTEKGLAVRKARLWQKLTGWYSAAAGSRLGREDASQAQNWHNNSLLSYLERMRELDETAWGRKLLAVQDQWDLPGLFRWERSGSLVELQKKKEALRRFQVYDIGATHGRKLLDTFGDSLRHVNRLYNKAFGYTARKVPAHMPHAIDKSIMAELQTVFPHEWDVTSSHRIRSSTDMQFAFAYFYYLMGVTTNMTAAEIFDQVDTDNSRVLSDREIRTLATRLYELPLDLQTLTGLENTLINCSKTLPEDLQVERRPVVKEKYYESDMPQVTRQLFTNCEAIQVLISKTFKSKHKYRFVVIDDSEVAFKMVKTNVSSVVGQLDDVRKHPKKFICLNDNIDHTQEAAETVKAILRDFFESFYPTPSRFELPKEYRNRFLHIGELREWRKYRDWLRFWTYLTLGLLIILAVSSFCSDQLNTVQRRYFRWHHRSTSVTVPSTESLRHSPQQGRAAFPV